MIKVVLLVPNQEGEPYSIIETDLKIKVSEVHDFISLFSFGIVHENMMWVPNGMFFSTELKALCLTVIPKSDHEVSALDEAGETGGDAEQWDIPADNDLNEQDPAANAPPPLTAEERRKLFKLIKRDTPNE